MPTEYLHRGLRSIATDARPSPRRNGRNTPLGATIAALANGRDVARKREERRREQARNSGLTRRRKRTEALALCKRVLGADMTAHALDVFTSVRFEDAVRERRAPVRKNGVLVPNGRADRPVVTLRKDSHFRSDDSEVVRHTFAVLLMVCEEVQIDGRNPGRACAAHPHIRVGRTREKLEDGWRRVVRVDQGGMAARLHCDARTVERILAVLQAAGILKAWQPPADKVAQWMRGDTYAFQLYELAEVPAELAALLRRWDVRAWQKHAKPKPGVASATASEPAGDPSGDELAAVMREAAEQEGLAALELVRRGKRSTDPPVRPRQP